MNAEEKIKLIEALSYISSVCDKHTCSVCPMRGHNDNCYIMEEIPSNWEINDNKEWRAFNFYL